MIIRIFELKTIRAVASFKLTRLAIAFLSGKVSIWWLDINLSLGGFRVVLLVGNNDEGIFSSSLECFVGMGFIGHFKFHFSPRTLYFFLKWSSHKTECFVGFQSLRLTNWIHSLFSLKFFKGKSNFVICFVLFLAKLDRQDGAAHLLTMIRSKVKIITISGNMSS